MPCLINALIKCPFRMIIGGTSSCGKSTFIKQLITESSRLLDKPLDYIIIFIGSNDSTLQEGFPPEFAAKVSIYKDFLPDSIISLINPQRGFGLMILDDHQEALVKNSEISNIFSKYSHHSNLSIIATFQNIFAKGEERLTLLRNSNYLCIFRSPLDHTLINLIISRLSSGGQTRKNIAQLFDYVLSKQRYIFISGHFSTPQELTFRSNLFGNVQTCYVLKKYG